jgi:hypothetical protein
MSESITFEQPLFEPCPDPWAGRHVFFNPETKQVIPARCKKWTCYTCAKINYYKVDVLLSSGNAQRFITLTRAGNTTEEIRLNLQKLVQAIRREGWIFEYSAMIELHLNGQPHIHILQRGDFIPQDWLSKKWETFTAKSYQGAGSFIVDIRQIADNQNIKGYLLKYVRKSWDADNLGPKSWAELQNRFPGLNHYRMSRNWLSKPVEKVEKWQIILKNMLPYQNTPIDPIEAYFYANDLPPVSLVEKKRLQVKPARPLLRSERSRAIVECIHSIAQQPLTAGSDDQQLTTGLVAIVQPTRKKKRGS